jgi:hypothetical protein
VTRLRLIFVTILVAGAVGGPAALALDSVASSRVPTVWCHGVSQTGSQGERPPASVNAPTVPGALAQRSRAYTFYGLWVIAPGGWGCFRAAAGSSGVRVGASRNSGEDQLARVTLFDATPGNHSGFLACGAFQSAARFVESLGFGGNYCQGLRVPPGASLSRTANVVKVVTPGLNTDIRYLWWFPSKRKAGELSCYAFIRRQSTAFCDVAYRDYNRRIRASLR